MLNRKWEREYIYGASKFDGAECRFFCTQEGKKTYRYGREDDGRYVDYITDSYDTVVEYFDSIFAGYDVYDEVMTELAETFAA